MMTRKPLTMSELALTITWRKVNLLMNISGAGGYGMSSAYQILLVDDEPQNLRMLERILKKDYVIETARSGEEALETIPRFRPDLILLDIMMTGIDGYETCRRIRADKRFNLVKLILVSGKAEIEERLHGYEAGADDYVVKPFDPEELRAKVRVFLRLKRAEEVDQIKGDLLTIFSHETKTPLSGIIGISELLREDKSLSQNHRDCAGLIYESGVQLLEFVRKTSLMCELKTGPVLKPEIRGVKESIEKTLAKCKAIVEEKNVSVDISVDESLALQADWSLFEKVIGYILDNAVKFSPNDGKVTVTADVVDREFTFSVKDEGKGIDKESIKKIFDVFSIRDVMHHQKGQGLSLAISREVVELHGGQMWAESPAGEGAKFFVRLPIREQQPGNASV